VFEQSRSANMKQRRRSVVQSKRADIGCSIHHADDVIDAHDAKNAACAALQAQIQGFALPSPNSYPCLMDPFENAEIILRMSGDIAMP
jgi:hypothetical protein